MGLPPRQLSRTLDLLARMRDYSDGELWERTGRFVEINHVLHLILTVLTCGLWAVVWIIMALRRGQAKTVTLYGNA